MRGVIGFWEGASVGISCGTFFKHPLSPLPFLMKTTRFIYFPSFAPNFINIININRLTVSIVSPLAQYRLSTFAAFFVSSPSSCANLPNKKTTPTTSLSKVRNTTASQGTMFQVDQENVQTRGHGSPTWLSSPGSPSSLLLHNELSQSANLLSTKASLSHQSLSTPPSQGSPPP